MTDQYLQNIQDITDNTLKLISPLLNEYFIAAFKVKNFEENGVVSGSQYATAVQEQYSILENITELIENQSK